MRDFVSERLDIGDGLELSLSSTPPSPSLFKVVMVTEGHGKWVSDSGEREVERATPWWAGEDSHGRWEGSAETRWLCLAGGHCPLEAYAEPFSRWSAAGCFSRCPGVSADARELALILEDCPFPCELKTLLARGKSLMLVSKVFHALDQVRQVPASYDVKLFRGDVERLRSARKLLVESMTAPPSISDLARQVGLNEVKLKAGFRRLWGTTVYGLLRQERMTEARRFLEAGEGNVGEAAFRVGFTNTSHFAQAFQKQFGVAPGAIARGAYCPR